MPVDQKQIKPFQKKIWEFYKNNKRDLPWRNTKDPYNIFISEVMLQQTQVNRVLPKYLEWISVYSDFKSLSNAKLQNILILWSGLGYNRRAKFLLEASRIIVNRYQSVVPDDPDMLVTLPGIGKATAASIVVFSYNKALPFIETNIRRVFIHEFFKDDTNIFDANILKLVTLTLDPRAPREWYYALMDYGSYLGKTITNPNRKSKSYTKQSTFRGSARELRGEILRIVSNGPLPEEEVFQIITGNKVHFQTAINQLIEESFIEIIDDKIQIKDNE